MSRDRRCQSDEKQPEEPMFRYEDGAEKKCDPDHAYRYGLNLERDGFMDHEIPELRSELRMVQKPVIQLG